MFSFLAFHWNLFRPRIRQRLDPAKIDYFISWITESSLLISIPWGQTNLKLENGEVISIPRQMLQAQQSQIVYLYKQHCDEFGIDSLSDRTVYSILNIIHASEQKFISGIDDFVKSAIDGWTILKKIIQQLPTIRETKNKSNILLENSDIYLKSKYGCHCDETEQTTTHCTIFALSQPNNPYYSQSCDHIHESLCAGMNYYTMKSVYAEKSFYTLCLLECLRIFELFDRIVTCFNNCYFQS